MQFTRFTDYALRVLVYVGQRPDEWVTIRQISDAYGISRNHLMKVVSFLGNRGYLLSQRGPGGGVRLKLDPAQVRLGAVVDDAEGDLNVMPVPDGLDTDLAEPHERLDRALRDAMEAFHSALAAYSLADIIEVAETSPAEA